MLDSIYHMPLSRKTLLWTSWRFPQICNPLVVYKILLHGVNSLPDATSFDNMI